MKKYTGDEDRLFQRFKERYKDISPEYQRKLNNFKKNLSKSEIVASVIYGTSRTNKSFNQIVEDLMDEHYSFAGSTLKSFRNVKTRTLEQNVERALQLRVKGRLSEFMKVHGEEFYEYNGETRTLLGWQKQYLLGNIDNSELNKIIKGYQDNNPEYDATSYSKHASRQAIIDERTD